MNWQNQVCEVCRLLDNDTRLKPCLYCPACNAWLCQADIGNLARRARAAAKKAVMKVLLRGRIVGW
jgi:hypothetical protein